MTEDQIVDKYMEVLFSGQNLDNLKEIFHENLEFEGPLATFHSARDYINDLKSAPPVDFSFNVINRFQLGTTVCLNYEFYKPGISTSMIQIFEIEDNLIKRIRLFFDAALFDYV